MSAVVDDRRPDRGDIHIVFTAGFSNVGAGTDEHDIYYGYYNGVTWTLPEIVADDDAGTDDGIDPVDIFQSSPAIAKRSGDPNLYLIFGSGTGEGLGVKSLTDVDQHPYFKILGRGFTSEDESIPVGGFQYDLTYTPVNPQDASADIDDNIVYVHVADNITGEGLGATGKQGDRFLAGDWETVASTLSDDDKFFEGKFNEDASSDHEWGDDGDKNGLLVKLNVLGSDSATNVQLIGASTASEGGGALDARTVRVGTDPTGSFVVAGDFFLLGADIDIVDSNTGARSQHQSARRRRRQRQHVLPDSLPSHGPR